MEKLSTDLIISILMLLPFKSVARCLSVSKFWNEIIKSPRFSKMYLKKSMDANTDRSLLLCNIDPLPTRFHKLELDDNDRIIWPGREVPQPLSNSARQTKIVGHCNGLVCICNEAAGTLNSELAIWNPSINRYRRVPNLPDNIIDSLPKNMILPIYGFAYCSSRDEYEIVQINRFRRYSAHQGTFISHVMVWTSRSNTWRASIQDFPAIYNSFVVWSRFFRTRTIENTFINDHLHWLILNSNNSRRILAFNIENEGFLDYELPAAAALSNLMRLEALGDHLYLVDHRNDSVIIVWRMNEYGNRDSWVMVYALWSTSPSQRIYSLFPTLLSKIDRHILNVANVAGGRADIFWVSSDIILRQVVGHGRTALEATSFVENFVLGDGLLVPRPQ